VSTPPLATIVGVVISGDGRGRELGFPTANLALDRSDLPADGIYAAWTRVDDDPEVWQASVSVGTNPTFAGDRERRVEVHLHDADLDLYGRTLAVTLVARLRPTLHFEEVDALVSQSQDDVERCRRLLADRDREGLSASPTVG
jgi:riboflavin kinase/FMN adenylyltransferase